MTEGGAARRRVRARVHGRVQGVFFRDRTRRRALELGLVGSAANLADGSVEIVVQGDPDAVEALMDFVRIGPPLAQVERLEVTEEAYCAELEGFRVS